MEILYTNVSRLNRLKNSLNWLVSKVSVSESANVSGMSSEEKIRLVIYLSS